MGPTLTTARNVLLPHTVEGWGIKGLLALFQIPVKSLTVGHVQAYAEAVCLVIVPTGLWKDWSQTFLSDCTPTSHTAQRH